MSAKRKIEWPTVDPFTQLEAGIRVPVNRRNGRWGLKRSGFAGKEAEKIEWAITKSHPDAPRFWSYQVPIDPETGFITIGDEEAVNYYNRDGGFLMLKVVSGMPNSYFVVPSRYAPHGLFDFDKVQAQRENGDYVYSLPQHGIVPSDSKTGKKFSFFFLLRMDRSKNEGMVIVEIDKLIVTRGKEHYRLILEDFPAPGQNRFEGTTEAVINQVRRKEELFDLPIDSAFDRYRWAKGIG